MHTERMATVELGIKSECVSVSDHIAYFWDGEREFEEGVGFLEVGLRGKDSCVVFGHPSANAKVLSILAARGFNQQKLEKENRLTVLGENRPAQICLLKSEESFKRPSTLAHL